MLCNLYRYIKRGVRHSLRRAHCKRHLVTPGKPAAYKLSGTKSSLSSLKRVPRPLFRQDSSCSNRHHHSGVIHKQGRRHEVGSTLDHPDRVVSPSRGFSNNMQQVAPAKNRPICHEIQQVASVSPVPDPLASAVDALSLPWEDLDAYTFPAAAILGKVVEKLQDCACKRIILVLRGGPTCPGSGI